ncbi:MAG: sigma-70 family RNA polymerase sigma factor [Anaerolineae bacterium]|nr:sigma-70 family RNA polymerase sigma factor [Anaerolineae bacterium]
MNGSEVHITKQAHLKQFIEAEKGRLLPILCLYVVRAKLAIIERSANAMAAELFDELVAEAIERADEFDLSGQPFAWLMGMASRLVDHKQKELGKDIELGKVPRQQAGLSEGEVFDRLPELIGSKAAENKQDEQLGGLLNRIPLEAQRVLQLAVHHDLDGEALAQALGMPPGAARVRLHRALDRLRVAMQA